MVKYLDFVVVGVLLTLGVFFQSFTVQSKVENKGMYYQNVECSDNVILKKVSGLDLDYSASFEQVGDSFDLFFEVVNSNEVDMKISDLLLQEDDSYIQYVLTYQDGSFIKNGDIIKSGEIKKIHYQVKYVHPIDVMDYTFDTSFHINYEQAL